jgi:hypothetical protein
MTDRELMQMALDALELDEKEYPHATLQDTKKIQKALREYKFKGMVR